MMRCFGLSCFYIVLALSISGSKEEVARQLNVTPDHVSRELRIFENKMGITVFEKSNNKLVLTPDGSRILSLNHNYYKHLNMLIGSSGTNCLRIGFSSSTLACAFITPIVGYLKTHPACRPAPNVYPYEELRELLSLGIIDIAVTSDNEMMMVGQTDRYHGEYELNMLAMKNDPVSISESFITPSTAGLKPLITSEDLYNELICDRIRYDNVSVGFVNDMFEIFILTYVGFGCGIFPYIPEGFYEALPFRAMPFYPSLRAGFTISLRKDSNAAARSEPFLRMLMEDPLRYHMIFK